MTTEQIFLLGGAIIVAAIAVIVFTIVWDLKKVSDDPESTATANGEIAADENDESFDEDAEGSDEEDVEAADENEESNSEESAD